MPLLIICAYNCLPQYLMSYRDLFTKPQYTSFVIVLLGFIQCQQARPLSGRQRGVAEGVSLSGLSRFFARSPWDTEALAARWQERFHTQLTPVVQAELARQQEVQPKRRWRAISTSCDRVSDWRRLDHATSEKGCKMEGIGKYHSTTHERRVRGHSLVQGLYVRGFATLPAAAAPVSTATRLRTRGGPVPEQDRA